MPVNFTLHSINKILVIIILVYYSKNAIRDDSNMYGESSYAILIMCSITSVENLWWPKVEEMTCPQSIGTCSLAQKKHVSR